MSAVLSLFERLSKLTPGELAQRRLLEDILIKRDNFVGPSTTVLDDRLGYGGRRVDSCSRILSFGLWEVYNTDSLRFGVNRTMWEDYCVCWSDSKNLGSFNCSFDCLRIMVDSILG
jgi:hypothetical protein